MNPSSRPPNRRSLTRPIYATAAILSLLMTLGAWAITPSASVSTNSGTVPFSFTVNYTAGLATGGYLTIIPALNYTNNTSQPGTITITNAITYDYIVQASLKDSNVWYNFTFQVAAINTNVPIPTNAFPVVWQAIYSSPSNQPPVIGMTILNYNQMTGYWMVNRSTISNGVPGAWVTIGNVPTPATSFVDTNVQFNAVYCYNLQFANYYGVSPVSPSACVEISTNGAATLLTPQSPVLPPQRPWLITQQATAVNGPWIDQATNGIALSGPMGFWRAVIQP